MNTFKIIRVLLFLAALFFTTLAQAQIEEGQYDKNLNYSVVKVDTLPLLQIGKEQLIRKLNKSIKHVTGGSTAWKGLTASDDRFETDYGTLFYFQDIIANKKIRFYLNSPGVWAVSLPVSKVHIKADHFYNSVQFFFDKREYVLEFAENVYYLLQPYCAEQLAEQLKIKQHNDSIARADSIQFSVAFAKYREMKEKPSITEEQRKYIVQANSFAKEKLYSQAIEAYKNALAIDQVAYPVAYYNLALLLAETKDFKLAVRNMKKYLLLLPDAPDARAAQDKIYEWER